jgi:hypothetical protein
MKELKSKLPYEVHYNKFDDGSGRGMFAARWSQDEFESIEDFIRFRVKYSSVLQSIIQAQPMEEIEKWFFSDPEWEKASSNIISSLSAKNGDAAIWLKSQLLSFNIPWLNECEHDTIYELVGGFIHSEWPELIATGKSGYLIIFVADSL